MAKEETAPKGTDKVVLEFETGVDQQMDFTMPSSVSAVDKKRRAGSALDLREMPRSSWNDSDDRPTARQLENMRRMDGQARALYRLITLPLRSALEGCTFVPDPQSEGGEKEAEFMRQALLTPAENGGMKVSFDRFMAQTLQALFEGFAAFEKVFWRPETGPLKGKYTLKKLAYRPSSTVTFLVDRHGGYAGFRQKSHFGGQEVDADIPTEYSFYYAAQEEERKFYGVSYFESAFYHYDKKVRMYYQAHLQAQRAAIGTRVGTHPANATTSQKNDFRAQLANLSLAQWMSLPEGWKVDTLREGGNFDFLDFINHHNNQMSKSVLAGFFDKDTGSGANENSFVSVAAQGEDLFVLMLRTIQNEIAAAINHYIVPQLIDLNFKDGHYPKFKWGALNEEQRSAVSSIFDKIVTQPQAMTPEFMRAIEEQMAKELGLEIDYSELPDPREALGMGEQGMLPGAAALGMGGQPGAEGALPEDEAPTSQLTAEFEEALLGVKDGEVVAASNILDPHMSSVEDVLALAGDFLSAADETVTLSGRFVRTAEGARKYNKVIGARISEGDGQFHSDRPVTWERIQSLQRQFAIARKFGNVANMRRVQAEFRAAVTEFSQGKSLKEIRDRLNSLNRPGTLNALNPLNAKTDQEKSTLETDVAGR